MIALLILGYALLITIDAPQLKRERCRREIIFYCVMMALAFTATVLWIYHIHVVNPVSGVQYVVKDLFKLLHLTYD